MPNLYIARIPIGQEAPASAVIQIAEVLATKGFDVIDAYGLHGVPTLTPSRGLPDGVHLILGSELNNAQVREIVCRTLNPTSLHYGPQYLAPYIAMDLTRAEEVWIIRLNSTEVPPLPDIAAQLIRKGVEVNEAYFVPNGVDPGWNVIPDAPTSDYTDKLPNALELLIASHKPPTNVIKVMQNFPNSIVHSATYLESF